MTRAEVIALARDKYGTEPDYPWEDDNIVLRHADNRKWYALFMRVPAARLGLAGDGVLEIMNLKCDSIISASLLGTAGYFPAYHMSKTSWISLAIERLSDEEIEQMLDLSYALTERKRKLRS